MCPLLTCLPTCIPNLLTYSIPHHNDLFISLEVLPFLQNEWLHMMYATKFGITHAVAFGGFIHDYACIASIGMIRKDEVVFR